MYSFGNVHYAVLKFGISKIFPAQFILNGLNYYVLAFKLIIWYKAIIYMHVFILNLFIFLNTCMSLTL